MTGPLYCCNFIAQRSAASRLKPLRGSATRSPDSSLWTNSKTLGSTLVSLRRACAIAQSRSRRSASVGASSASI